MAWHGGTWWLGAVVVLVTATAVSASALGQCDPCPKLTFCAGTVLRDHCDCEMCSSDLYQPHVRRQPVVKKDGACVQVKCPKFKVCMENYEGVPLCTCPTSYTCKNKRQKEVCGTDGMTYPSRCHMRLARCQTGTRIKVSKKGSCQAVEEDSEQTLSRVRRRKERRRRRNGKKGDAKERAEDKEKRERRRRKRRLRKLRRRQRRKSLKDRFQQTFSSYKW